MGLFTGFIEGTVTYDDNGTLTLLPFQDTIAEAAFRYNGEVQMAETFSNAGVRGASAACFHREECFFDMSSENISWAFLQAVLAQRDEARTAPVPVTETLVAVTGTTNPEVTLSFTPATGTSITASDSDGVQFTATNPSGAIIDLGATAVVGDTYSVAYFRDAGASERSIEVGKNTGEIEEVSVYGRFKGCPDDLLIIANRAVIVPELTLGVGDNPAEASVSMPILRDSLGVFASIIRWEP
jgi:hypothetical protein